MVNPAEIGELLAGLDEALGEIADGRGGVLADDAVCGRKLRSLKVRALALEALQQRGAAGHEAQLESDVASAVVEILCDELHRDLCALAAEALGYYALPAPDERPGENEAPLGGAYARSARQGMLARLFASPENPQMKRDRLARLLSRKSNETGTGN